MTELNKIMWGMWLGGFLVGSGLGMVIMSLIFY